jgi:hypothetical protein
MRRQGKTAPRRARHATVDELTRQFVNEVSAKVADFGALLEDSQAGFDDVVQAELGRQQRQQLTPAQQVSAHEAIVRALPETLAKLYHRLDDDRGGEMLMRQAWH